jgi:rRNA-processing protein FCF1
MRKDIKSDLSGSTANFIYIDQNKVIFHFIRFIVRMSEILKRFLFLKIKLNIYQMIIHLIYNQNMIELFKIKEE